MPAAYNRQLPSITCPSIITSLYVESSVIVTSGMHTHTQDPQSYRMYRSVLQIRPPRA